MISQHHTGADGRLALTTTDRAVLWERAADDLHGLGDTITYAGRRAELPAAREAIAHARAIADVLNAIGWGPLDDNQFEDPARVVPAWLLDRWIASLDADLAPGLFDVEPEPDEVEAVEAARAVLVSLRAVHIEESG